MTKKNVFWTTVYMIRSCMLEIVDVPALLVGQGLIALLLHHMLLAQFVSMARLGKSGLWEENDNFAGHLHPTIKSCLLFAINLLRIAVHADVLSLSRLCCALMPFCILSLSFTCFQPPLN